MVEGGTWMLDSLLTGSVLPQKPTRVGRWPCCEKREDDQVQNWHGHLQTP